ncbi:ABC transporter permease [Rhodobacteraceae bacterium]|nr:ABC transporter permease [Paracoccaceae bacterium]
MAALLLPFAGVRRSRIALPDAQSLSNTFGNWGYVAGAVYLAVLLAFVVRLSPVWRVGLGGLLCVALVLVTGRGAHLLAPDVAPYGRVSPGAGAWLALAVAGLLWADAMVRLRPPPLWRLATGGAVLGGVCTLIASGYLDDLSVIVEYHNRARSFWSEARAHILLALGSFGVACLIGLPLGLWAAKSRAIRGPLASVLTGLQTIPSIAMFGLMIVPLGWVAANVPGAGAIGISGIGMAPAFLALVLYALLPVVSNTEAGLRAVPPATEEAARAMGLNARQRLWQVEIPLALPVLLTGARIVLVQNIGLATVGALIGAGGFGAFVFQGLGQSAVDLILLGTIPTVALAFMTALLLDTAVALCRKDHR